MDEHFNDLRSTHLDRYSNLSEKDKHKHKHNQSPSITSNKPCPRRSSSRNSNHSMQITSFVHKD